MMLADGNGTFSQSMGLDMDTDAIWWYSFNSLQHDCRRWCCSCAEMLKDPVVLKSVTLNYIEAAVSNISLKLKI